MGPQMEAKPDDESVFVNLSDLPYDLMRFNISAKTGSDRREARKALLLKMGAASAKKQYVNYKILMHARKEEKMQALLRPPETATTAVNKRVPPGKIKKKGKNSKKLRKKMAHSSKAGKRWRKLKKSRKT
ncbi:hypothetical protein FGIG_01770 [Fasciola gigantica]|uniref:Uncharacterized protein n=1 Tax=Fasciola gigantica TaxID=46835 RepID=A0A504Y731_FASGI|nr:hypothetical protein FGIG_01770 [Fasciola gigantica]